MPSFTSPDCPRLRSTPALWHPTTHTDRDLVYRRWGVVVEYEGAHHQVDRAQYVKDIDRYSSLRRAAVPYVQVTKEKLARPRRLVLEVYDALVAQGYDGTPPEFGEQWRHLFARVSDVVAARRRWSRVASRR